MARRVLAISSGAVTMGRMQGPVLEQVNRTFVRHEGRVLSYFGGCDYYRLSSHPAVLAAAREGLERHGLNVAASRLTTGNHPLYGELEDALARFFGADQAVLVSNGYLANLVAAQSMAGYFSHVLIDEKAHSSLRDASVLLGGEIRPFRHLDAEDLARIAALCGPRGRVVLLTDGLFSMDGAAAPLKLYWKALPRNGWLWVDDAHGAGVLGTNGRGSLERAGLKRERRMIQTITLSKAFGGYGGAVLGSAAVARGIWRRSRMFAGNTPLPLPLTESALAAVQLLDADGTLIERLRENTAHVKDGLRKRGWAVGDPASPIISFAPRANRERDRIERRLLAREIYPSWIRYPGGAPGGFFRFAISSEHSGEQLEGLLCSLSSVE